jgi:membrane fusion protein, multidrug efflux system
MRLSCANNILIFLRSWRECANASVLAKSRATSRAASFTLRTTCRSGMFGHFALSGHTRNSGTGAGSEASHPIAGHFIEIAGTTGTLAGCIVSRNAYVPPPPPKVVVALPVQKPVTLYLDLTGNTAPFRTVQLVARVQGYLETIDYKDGTAVTKGTQLFDIERDVYQAQLDLAKAQLAHDQAVVKEAQVDLARYQQLAKTNAIPQQQAQDQQYTVEQDEATVKLDQANVETATINLGFTRVLAPFDGVVTNHLVDLGALVGVSGPTTLATIIQGDPLYAYFNASEPQVLAIRRNRAQRGESLRPTDLADIPVEIGLQDEEGYPHKGHLDY